MTPEARSRFSIRGDKSPFHQVLADGPDGDVVPRTKTTSAVSCFQAYNAVMRWTLVFLESLASAVFADIASLLVLVIASHLWTEYALRKRPTESADWYPVSVFAPHWKIVVWGIPSAIFALGFSVGLWFFSKRLHG